jgi:hypothetical protein
MTIKQMCYNIPMPEQAPDMPMSAEPIAAEAGGVPAPEKVFEGAAGSVEQQETTVFGGDEQEDATNAEALNELRTQMAAENPDLAKIMNNPALGQDGTVTIDGKKVPLSELIPGREQQVVMPAAEDDSSFEESSEVVSEDNQIEQVQGPTPEEIEERVEEVKRELIEAKIEELANILLSYSDEDIDSIAVSGVPVSGERIIVNSESLEPSFAKSIFEALRDDQDLHALVEQIYGDLEQEARAQVMREIANEQSNQVDESAKTEDFGEEVPSAETDDAEVVADVVAEDTTSATQSTAAITSGTPV